jgi:hypothetical protein
MGITEPRLAGVKAWIGIGGGGGNVLLGACIEGGLGGGEGGIGESPSLGFLPLKAWATCSVSCRALLCLGVDWESLISSDFFLRAANARLSLEPVEAAA